MHTRNCVSVVAGQHPVKLSLTSVRCILGLLNDMYADGKRWLLDQAATLALLATSSAQVVGGLQQPHQHHAK
jgi:hypothetical protein